MLKYSSHLKSYARDLRKNQTDSEMTLWFYLRGKQLLGIQFYRQKPIGQYIVDFLASKAQLVVEVDGSQHVEGDNLQNDRNRDQYLNSLGLKVLRFNSREVLKETEAVLEIIYQTILERLNSEIPPNPLFSKGGEEKERKNLSCPLPSKLKT